MSARPLARSPAPPLFLPRTPTHTLALTHPHLERQGLRSVLEDAASIIGEETGVAYWSILSTVTLDQLSSRVPTEITQVSR